MPIANPPTHVPWFPDGDPLLPENRDVAVKPLLRLFDPYQTYDALIFSTLNFQLPIDKVRIDNSSEGNVIDPFSLAGKDAYGLLANGYYALLVERFTPSDAPFADKYVDTLKEIADYLFNLAIGWEFEEPKPLISSPVPRAITVEEKAKETDTATVTFFYADSDCLSKRSITLNSYEGNQFNWSLSLEYPSIALYSLVVESKTGYLKDLINNTLDSEAPYLLYSNIGDFIQYFKDNFNTSTVTNNDVDDPFNLDLFIKEYTSRVNQKFQETVEQEWEIIETDFPLYRNEIWSGNSYRVRAIVNNQLSEKFKIGDDKNNFVFAMNELEQEFNRLISEQTLLNPNQANLDFPDEAVQNGNSSGIVRINDEIPDLDFGESFETVGIPFYQNFSPISFVAFEDKLPYEVGDVKSIITGSVVGYPNRPQEGFNFIQYVRKAEIDRTIVWKVCTQKLLELVNTSKTITFNFDVADKEVINWLDALNLKEVNYNFVSIIRANAYSSSLQDILPVYASTKPNEQETKLYLIADTDRDVPIPNSVELTTETEELINLNQERENIETETFEVQNEINIFLNDCPPTEEVERATKYTVTTHFKSQTFFKGFDLERYQRIERGDLIFEIDKHQWEWEVKLDELTGEEVKELSREMPDSIRIKEIHRALDAQKYSKYELNGETKKREANLGYYITRMGALLGINVMPDASPYFPPFAEKVEPDEQGEIDLPDEYGLESFRESTEKVDPLRVQNPDFENYEIEKNNFAYRLQSRMFGEDPNTGEDTRLQEGGFILTHNIPQLIQAILSDLKEAFSWEELSASQFNVEDKIRELVTKQFTDPEDEETPAGESLNPREVQTEGLLNLITAYLAIPYGRAGYQDYPVTTPNTLIKQEKEEEYNPGEDGFDPKFETKHQNYSEFYTWLVKQFDAVAGQFPIDINIEDNDLIKLEDQKLELSLPNLAETLAEMMGTNITNQALNNAILSVLLRNLAETGSNRVLNVKQYALQEAMSEYLGYKTGQGKQKVPFTFNPLDVVGDEENPGIESLAKAMESKEIEITVDKNEEGETLEQKLSTLIEAARITKAQNYRTVDAKGNIKSQLADIIKRGGDFLDNEGEPDQDGKTKFDRWLENIEQGFTNEPGVEEKDKPFGKDRNRRPRIRKVGEQDQQ